MPLPVVCSQPLFHNSLNAFHNFASVTHFPNRAEHDKALNGSSPKQEKFCQKQRLCLDTHQNALGGKSGIYLILEEEERFSSGYECFGYTGEVNRAKGNENHKVTITRTLEIEGSAEGGRQMHRQLC